MSFGSAAESGENALFCLGVEAGGDFVQQKDGGVSRYGTAMERSCHSPCERRGCRPGRDRPRVFPDNVLPWRERHQCV